MISENAPVVAPSSAKKGLKTAALVAFVGYCAWNVFWLGRGQLPPSIWKYCTGLPCPTTGMTRSLGALAKGDWTNFFAYNPFTILFIALFLLSMLLLLIRWKRDRRLELPRYLAGMWFLALTGAWIAKFLLGSHYW